MSFRATRQLGKATLVERCSEATVTVRGVLHVHACPAALCPHVNWAVARVLGVPVDLPWSPQPAMPGRRRVEVEFEARVGTAARLASALKGWDPLRFEAVELASPGVDGCRYSYTGRLGLHVATISANGDVLVPEERLRALLDGGEDLRTGLDRLLGVPWDDELEPLRRAGYGAPVAMVAQVV